MKSISTTIGMGKILLFILLIFNIQISQGQLPGVGIDMTSYWQQFTESRTSNEGSKIHLGNRFNDTYLRIGSTHEDFDLFDPFISRDKNSNLHFIVEDPESSEYSEQMELTKGGDLSITNLAGSSIRNVVVDHDGTLQAQEFGGAAGVYSVTMFDFVSWANPGDDHNSREFFGTMHHESVFSGVETLIAPLHLPQGAKIKEVRVYYRDENMSDSIQFELIRSPYMSPGVGSWIRDTIGTTSYTTGVEMIQTYFDYPIDNLSYMHYISVKNPNGVNSWPGQEVGVVGAIIRYDL